MKGKINKGAEERERWLRIRGWLKYGLEGSRGERDAPPRDRIYETVNFWPIRKRIIRRISRDLSLGQIFLAQLVYNLAGEATEQ